MAWTSISVLEQWQSAEFCLSWKCEKGQEYGTYEGNLIESPYKAVTSSTESAFHVFREKKKCLIFGRKGAESPWNGELRLFRSSRCPKKRPVAARQKVSKYQARCMRISRHGLAYSQRWTTSPWKSTTESQCRLTATAAGHLCVDAYFCGWESLFLLVMDRLCSHERKRQTLPKARPTMLRILLLLKQRRLHPV